MTHQTIIVLDCGSQYTQLIARRLRELSVYSEIWPPNTPAGKIRDRNPAGVILSGGPKSVSDPGAPLCEALRSTAAQAKVKANGHPTPLWAVGSQDDRCAYIGEAKAMWLYAIAWPAPAGYVLADRILLHDLTESLPSELVFGALSPCLGGGAR